jgi:hypothetical protein
MVHDYDKIFNQYLSKEGIPFYLLNKRIIFPEDKTLDIYGSLYLASDTPWTNLSYQLYDTIDYWWILCSINTSSIFYAKEGDVIHYIKPEYLNFIFSNI